MEKETIQQEPTQPSQEEMVHLLSQTVVAQDNEIKQLKTKLADAEKAVAYLQEERSKPCDTMEAEESVRMRHLTRYLEHEIEYAEAKIKELRYHLAEYPEDNYSQVDLQNSLLHLNYLKAMMRRLKFYN